jgi:hypothetical protein
MKPIDHSKAIAKVTLDGLAVCHFDSFTRHWAISILRQSNHLLKVTIDGGAVPPGVLTNARSIRIATRNPDPPSPEDYPGGCFYVKGDFRYKENMCWAINLHDPDDVGEPLQYKPPSAFPITTVDISDALFYVTRHFPTDLYWVPSGINPNLEEDKGEKYRYGVTSDELGADIFCKPGGQVVIDIDGTALPPLDYNSRIHHIDIRNMDAKLATGERLEQGDFSFYYQAVQSSFQPHTFWGLPKDIVEPGPGDPTDPAPISIASDRTDCNTVWAEP